ncbi:MAG: hypothetical protein HOV94_31280 [Saccharothrix sp.]|nr:hypothetical protein [Saccharothrix sp.]
MPSPRTPHHYLDVFSPRGADQPIWLPRLRAVDLAAPVKGPRARQIPTSTAG